MKALFRFAFIATIMLAGWALTSCSAPADTGTCLFTANDAITVYRLPTMASDQFGVISSGESYEIQAQTADGWVGFDPGVAQAGNIGLARNRWILLNATVSPSCLSSVDLVTLADVQADVDASNQ